jgi:DHA1 family multidrug resistance protein-like MFS transporter
VPTSDRDLTAPLESQTGSGTWDARRGANVVRWMALTMLVVTGAQTFLFAVLPSLGRTLHLSEPEVSLLLSVPSGVAMLVTPWWGKRSDDWGRKPALLAGLIGYVFGTTLFLVLLRGGTAGWIGGGSLFLALLGSRIAHALGAGGCQSIIMALAVDATNAEQRMPAMTLLSTSGMLGTVAGPAVAAALAGLSVFAPFYFFIGSTIVLAIAMSLTLPSRVARADQTKSGTLRMFDPRVFFYLWSGAVTFTALASTQFVLGFYVRDVIAVSGDGVRVTGLALSSLIGATILVQTLLSNYSAWPASHRIGCGFAVLALSEFALGCTRGIAAMLFCTAAVGVGIGLVVPAFRSGASLAVPGGEQGRLSGILGTCAPFGYVVGPIASAQFYAIHPRVPFVVVVAGAVAMMVWAFARSARR